MARERITRSHLVAVKGGQIFAFPSKAKARSFVRAAKRSARFKGVKLQFAFAKLTRRKR